MKLILPFILTAVLPRLALAGVTIDYTAQIGQRHVVDHQSALILDGDGEVRLGTFSEDSFDLEVHGTDLQRLREAWIPLGMTTVREVLGEPSRFSARASFTRPELDGKKLYLWILATTGGAVTATYSNLTSYGLYSSSDVRWTVPSANAIPPANSTLINSSQIDEIYAAGVSPNRLALETPPPATLDYATWAAAAFPLSWDPRLKSASADPDGDGWANALEQFTGRNPLFAEDWAPISMVMEDSGMEVTFHRDLGVPAGAGGLELSTDMVDWTPLEIGYGAAALRGTIRRPWTIDLQGVTPIADGKSENVSLRIDFASEIERIFLRLSVDR